MKILKTIYINIYVHIIIFIQIASWRGRLCGRLGSTYIYIYIHIYVCIYIYIHQEIDYYSLAGIPLARFQEIIRGNVESYVEFRRSITWTVSLTRESRRQTDDDDDGR
jgi:hypothetical protein